MGIYEKVYTVMDNNIPTTDPNVISQDAPTPVNDSSVIQDPVVPINEQTPPPPAEPTISSVPNPVTPAMDVPTAPLETPANPVVPPTSYDIPTDSSGAEPARSETETPSSDSQPTTSDTVVTPVSPDQTQPAA